MKKTLLAAALMAGFAGAAQAETSVTLYGLIDVGIGYNRVTHVGVPSGTGNEYHGSRIGMINGVQNGSRWGLRGTEDLGNGLRAVFQLESGFNNSNGRSAQGGRLFGRHSTLGLASDSWGQLDFGRQTNMSSKYMGAIDPFAAGFGQANIGHGFSAANTVRYDNMVMYRTPDISGFQFGVGYSFSTNDNPGFRTNENVRALTAGIRYLNGPLNVALTYDQLRDVHSVNQSAKPRYYGIGASYDLEVVKLSAAYARTTDGWFGGQGVDPRGGLDLYTQNGQFANGFKANSYMVGASAPIGGASNILASWQMVDPSNDKLNGHDETMNVFSVGYTYDFSKRTNLYTYASYAKNYAFIDDAKSTAVGVGLRHRF